nr:ATP-binding protein [bacterium]
VVEEVREMLDPRIRESNAEIRIPRSLPSIMCDRSQTTEIFLNLISNAIKYNDEQAKLVEIGFTVAEERDIHQHDDANGVLVPDAPQLHNQYIFYVSDNGIGISEKYKDTVFGAFRRLHARDKYGGGTGVGLAIVKKMVERQGGRIWVESEPGQGSTFHFTVNPDVVAAGGNSES